MSRHFSISNPNVVRGSQARNLIRPARAPGFAAATGGVESEITDHGEHQLRDILDSERD